MKLSWYAENLPSGVYFYQLKGRRIYSNEKNVIIKVKF